MWTQKKSMIYAHSKNSENTKYAMGYVDYYRSQYEYLSQVMFQNQYRPELVKLIQKRLAKEAFHFASRIRKTHHVCIPVDVIYMKLKGFIREIANDELNHNFIQLELPL